MAQRRWYTAATAARVARVELERASTSLASAKEAYAQLMRSGPVHLAMQLPSHRRSAGDERPRLELTAWSITRGDIGRRKGLRRLLEAAASGTPQLRTPGGAAPGFPRGRSSVLQPMPRAPASETPHAASPLVAPLPPSRAPAAPASPAADAAPPKTSSPVEPGRPTGATSSLAPSPRPRAATPKPWDFIEPAAQPARPVAVARAAVATRTRTPPAPKPWDFIEPTVPVVAARPAARVLPVANTSPAAKPWDFIEPAARR
jgi:hypothetical protein